MGSVYGSQNQRACLMAACLGFMVVLLDVSVVNVALETLRGHFSGDVADLQWVVNAYTLVFAALLLTAGALADRLGAKRVFVAGFAIFTIASLACGLAPSLWLLVAARLVQGLGAALLMPSSLLLLQRAYPDSAQRNRAVGVWGAAGGIALAAGPVLGGVLITHVGWRSIFLINLPLGLLGIVWTLRHAPADRTDAGRGIDLPGQVAAILALAALTTALTEAARLGWSHPGVWGSLVVSLAAALGFGWIEQRSQDPMLPLALFCNRSFSIASAVGLVLNFAYYGLVFVFSLFFQSVEHLSAQQTGFAFLPMTGILVVMTMLAGRWAQRWGARTLMVAGLLVAAFGYLLLLPVQAGQPYSALVLPMLLASGGLALVVPTITIATLAAVQPRHGGIASGVLNAARQIGGMLGVAVYGYLVRNTEAAAFVQGMHLSITLAVVLLVLGGAVSYFGLPHRRQPGTAPIATSANKACRLGPK